MKQEFLRKAVREAAEQAGTPNTDFNAEFDMSKVKFLTQLLSETEAIFVLDEMVNGNG